MSDFGVVVGIILLLAFLAHGVGIGAPMAVAATIPRKEDWYPLWDMVGDLAAHDPSIAQEDGKWWVFHTGEGLQVKYSSDGYTWTQGEPVFKEPLSWWKQYAPKMNYNDVWAPDIQKFKDKWLLYYSVSEFGKNTSAIGLASSTSIAGGDWRDEGLVISSGLLTGYNAIDPNLFLDKEGNPWLVFGSWFSGIQVVPLNVDTMKPVDAEAVKTIARRRIQGQAAGIEGPIITYKDGYYYLFVSIDHCCVNIRSDYKIAVGRSRNVDGPYVDKHGIDLLDGGGTIIDAGSTRYNGVGGQDVYENRLLVRHGYDRVIRGLHVLLVSDLAWDDEGWPVVCESEMNGYYKIQNKATGEYLTIAFHNTMPGAKAELAKEADRASFEWQIYRKEEEYYRIQNRNSFKYLEVVGASTDAGAAIQQGGYENRAHRLWQLVPQDDGYYRIVNKGSGLVLEAADPIEGGGSSVVQGEQQETDHQLWRLIWASN